MTNAMTEPQVTILKRDDERRSILYKTVYQLSNRSDLRFTHGSQIQNMDKILTPAAIRAVQAILKQTAVFCLFVSQQTVSLRLLPGFDMDLANTSTLQCLEQAPDEEVREADHDFHLRAALHFTNPIIQFEGVRSVVECEKCWPEFVARMHLVFSSLPADKKAEILTQL